MAHEATAVGKEGSAILLQAARPEVFRVNAFRITGLPVDASAFDITKQAEKIQMFEKWGGGQPQRGAFRLEPAPNGDQLRGSLQRLRDPEQRLVDEFFWFWPHELGQGKTDEALVALARGNEQTASKVWSRQESYHSSANVSTHNLAVLSHVRALDLELLSQTRPLTPEEAEQRDALWPSAFKRWKLLLDDEGFWSRLTARIRDLEDPRLTAGSARRMRGSLPLALLFINAQLAARAADAGNADAAGRHVKLVRDSGFDREAIEDSLRLAVEPLRSRIKNYSRTAEQETDQSPEKAEKTARWLLDQSKPLLNALDLLLPAGNATRDGAHDEVGLRALACHIAFGNKTKNWAVSLQLLNEILPLAASSSARARIQENLNIVKANDDARRCFFCEQTNSDDDCAVEVQMYGNVVRTPTYNGTNITWQKLALRIARCRSCKSIHGKVDNWTILGGVAGVLAGLGCCIPLASEDHVGWAIAVFLILAIGFCGAAAAIASNKFQQGIKGEGDKTNSPHVQEMVGQGWEFGEGPSTD